MGLFDGEVEEEVKETIEERVKRQTKEIEGNQTTSNKPGIKKAYNVAMFGLACSYGSMVLGLFFGAILENIPLQIFFTSIGASGAILIIMLFITFQFQNYLMQKEKEAKK